MTREYRLPESTCGTSDDMKIRHARQFIIDRVCCSYCLTAWQLGNILREMRERNEVVRGEVVLKLAA